MLRKLGISVAIASAVMVQNVNALGMGEIRVRSALNEPLYAEIQLLQVKNLSPLQIRSRLADLNDFALANLATQRALSDVRFQVRVNRDGTGRVILTSKLPVTEPFMNFLVEVNWPSGRLVREYTLLLDPPSYNTAQNERNYQQSVQQTLVPAPVPATRAAPVISAPERPAVQPKSSTNTQRNVKPGQYYIRSKDTLWDIAVANKPDASISSRQMMVLIQRKNPHAFPSANINMMKANQVIELPTREELAALSAADASKEVLRQTRLWNAGLVPAIDAPPVAAPVEKAAQEEVAKPEKPAMKDPSPAKEMVKDQKPGEDMSVEEKMMAAMDAKPAPVQQEKPVEKGVLNVVSAQAEKEKMEAQAAAQAAALASSEDAEKIAELLKNNAELDTKLALSQESIDQLQRSGDELSKKLETMAKQLEDINRLIMLKDEQLSAFQQERDEMEKAFEMKEREEREKSWLDKLLESPMQLAALVSGWLIAIAAAVMLLLRRRNKAEPEEEVAEKNEPSISLPDDVIEEELEELQSLEEAEESVEDVPVDEELADLGEVDDLDLDLDLDMDLDLDESLETSMVEDAAVEEAVDADDDLAAELDAQLEGDDDDDDLLEGIDSLDFDLGDVDEADTEEMGEEEEQQALSELASVMDDEPAAEGNELDTLDETDELEIDLEEPDDASADDIFEAAAEAAQEPSADDVFEAAATAPALDELEADMEVVAEEDMSVDDVLEAAATQDDNIGQVSDEPEPELALEVDDLDVAIDETSVEELELDISELEEDAISLEDLEADELLSTLEASDLELEEELDPAVGPQGESESDEVEEQLDLDDEELFSLDSAAIDVEEEEEAIPMDSSLDDLLSMESDDSEDEVTAEPQLDEEIDELLNSTDDDIALDEVQPSADADGEAAMDFLAGEDGVQMKLDLARAYMEMGDSAGATEIIEEIMQEADEQQRSEAQEMLDKLKS